ncbi:MAG: radical SAM protein, partial [Gammaproteobacteria bacterium]
VNGLIFKKGWNYIAGQAQDGKGGEYQITAKRKEIEDLDSIPYPDYEGFELERHLSASFSGNITVGKNVLAMIASRSCPYNCTFCFHPVGRKYRQRSLDNIFSELDYLLSKYKIETLSLNDELFARDVPRLKDFCARIKKRNVKWYSSFRVDDMTEETVKLIKDSNCTVAGFGLESADDRILKSMRKCITLEQIEKALALMSKARIPISGSFILGDLEETLVTANKTLDWWDKHRQYNINLIPIAAYPGTHIYKYACEKGIIKDRIQFLKDGCPPVNVSKMTDEEFATVMERSMDLAISNTKELSTFSFSNVNEKESVIDIAGECKACGERNEWKEVRLFSGLCIVTCRKCKQQYRPSLTANARANIEANMKKLLENYDKIAVWGMVYHAVDIFCNSEVLKSPRIYAVDISSSKIGMALNGKRVSNPDIIGTEKIDLVIISALNHFPVIEYQTRNNYKNVEKLISVISLLGDGSDLDCLS